MDLELKEGTSVFTTDGEEVGKINRFILDPHTDEVTHVVVQKGWLLPEDKVVPIDMINTATSEKVTLKEESRDLEQLPPFEESHYVDMRRENGQRSSTPYPAASRYYPAYYWYPPFGYLGYPAYGLGYAGWPPAKETTRNIPESTVPLKEGSNMVSSDDKNVGEVERIFVDADSNRATHILVSDGFLFKERTLIPVNWVSSVEEDEVHLAVSSSVLQGLPAYRPSK